MTITINVHFLVKVKTGPLWFMYNYTTLSTQVPEGTVVTSAYLDTVAHRTVKNYISGSAVFTTGEVQVDNSTDTLMDDIMNKINKTVEPIDIPEAPVVENVSNKLEQREKDFAKQYLGNWLIKQLGNPRVVLKRRITVDTSDQVLWHAVYTHRELLEEKGYTVTTNEPDTLISNYPVWPVGGFDMAITITWGEQKAALVPPIVHEGYMPGQK